MTSHLLTFHTLSPLHCGIGQDVGAIELPIAREKPTHIPVIPGSSIKGVLRAEKQDPSLQKLAFGPETSEASDHAGAIQFSDARLVLLPMRSLKGVFAWTTSPYLLERLRRDLKQAGQPVWTRTPEVTEAACLTTGTTSLVHGERVYLDDLDFKADRTQENVEEVAGILRELFFPAKEETSALAKRLCVVPDDVMALLLEMGTELQTRVCLDPDTKTVKKGQLWQEENLPVESLLVGLVQVNEAPAVGNNKGAKQEEIAAHLRRLCSVAEGKATLQFGGKSTVGKGLCHVALVGKE